MARLIPISGRIASTPTIDPPIVTHNPFHVSFVTWAMAQARSSGAPIRADAECRVHWSHRAMVEAFPDGTYRFKCFACEAAAKRLRVPRGALSLCEEDMLGCVCLYEEPMP